VAAREPEEFGDVLVLDDVINIDDHSFRISDGVLTDFFNILPFHYGRDLSGRTSGGPVTDFRRGVRIVLPDSDGWASTLAGDRELEDTGSQTNFDQAVAAPQMDLYAVSDRSLALSVLNRVLSRYSFPMRRVELTVPLSGTSIDIGDVFAVTHVEGIGADGWVGRILRCLHHELDANDNAVRLIAYDLGRSVSYAFVLGDRDELPTLYPDASGAELTYGFLADRLTGRFSNDDRGRHL